MARSGRFPWPQWWSATGRRRVVDLEACQRDPSREWGEMAETPQKPARREIDANLEAAGWLVQDLAEMDLTAGPGVAVREFPMKAGFGSADYALYVGFRRRRRDRGQGRGDALGRRGANGGTPQVFRTTCPRPAGPRPSCSSRAVR